MKVPGSSVLLCATIWLSLNVVGEEATAIKVQPRPTELAELLKVLPACPDEWAIKRSEARRLYREHLEAYAVREYEKILPPEEPGQKVAPKPEVVVITIRDTCGSGPHIEPFRKENAPVQGGDFDLGSWKQYPAMMVRLGPDRRALRVLVADRFVIELAFSGNNPRALNLWMKQCDLQALARLVNEESITIRGEVVLRFLDELRPERTRIYLVPAAPDRPADDPPETSSPKSANPTQEGGAENGN